MSLTTAPGTLAALGAGGVFTIANTWLSETLSLEQPNFSLVRDLLATLQRLPTSLEELALGIGRTVRRIAKTGNPTGLSRARLIVCEMGVVKFKNTGQLIVFSTLFFSLFTATVAPLATALMSQWELLLAQHNASASVASVPPPPPPPAAAAGSSRS